MLFKRADHLSLFWVRLIQFTPSHSLFYKLFNPSVYAQVSKISEFPCEISPPPVRSILLHMCHVPLPFTSF